MTYEIGLYVCDCDLWRIFIIKLRRSGFILGTDITGCTQVVMGEPAAWYKYAYSILTLWREFLLARDYFGAVL